MIRATSYNIFMARHCLDISSFSALLPLLEIVFRDRTEKDVHDFLAATVDKGADPWQVRILLSEGRDPELIAEHWPELLKFDWQTRLALFPVYPYGGLSDE